MRLRLARALPGDEYDGIQLQVTVTADDMRRLLAPIVYPIAIVRVLRRMSKPVRLPTEGWPTDA